MLDHTKPSVWFTDSDFVKLKDSVDDALSSKVVVIDHTKLSVWFTNNAGVLGSDIDDHKENLDNEDIDQKLSEFEQQAIKMLPSTLNLLSR